MGVDIYSNDGVLVSVDEFLGSIIKKPKVKRVIAGIKDLIEKLDVEYMSKEAFVPLEKALGREVAGNLNSVLDTNAGKWELEVLDRDKLVEIIASWVENYVEEEDSFDCYLSYPEEIAALLNVVLDVCVTTDVPSISSMEIFGSYRYSGLYEVELNKPYVLFSKEDCFELISTDTGKNLAKALKQRTLELSSWATYSI